MGTYDESILTETKNSLGVAEDVTIFDVAIRMHINSAISTLTQLGIGPEGGFEILDADATWTDFVNTDLRLSQIKSYVFLRVKMLFDPPPNSWVSVAMKDQIEQMEWRLNMVREGDIPAEVTPLPEEDEYWLLDGGVI